MIEQFIIMNDAGLPIYSWKSEEESIGDENLLSGFITALNHFAQGERGEDLKKITLDPTTFIFERKGGLVFLILTKDPEFEKIIWEILQTLVSEFIQMFEQEIKDFGGNISIFSKFTDVVSKTFDDFLYWDYIRNTREFLNTPILKGMLYLDRNSGETLYVKAKQYIDRKALEFQTNIHANAAQRFVLARGTGKLIGSFIISRKGRGMIFRVANRVVLVEIIEIALIEEKPPSALPSEKQMKKTLKSPGKLKFETKNPIVLYNEKGQLVYEETKNQNTENTKDVAADLGTYLNSAESILEKSYKDEAYFSTILASKYIDLALNLPGAMVLFPGFEKIPENTSGGISLLTLENWVLNGKEKVEELIALVK